MKTSSRNEFAPAVTLVPTVRRGRFRAFTLVEILVVLGMIVILLSAVIPVVTSLSKANGRKAAVANLLGGIEQARAEAIKGGSSWIDKCGNTRGATYVIFAAFGSGAQATLDRYNYRSYAIFQDTPNLDADPTHCYDVKQLSPWKSLPTGVALRAAGSAALSNLPSATAIPSWRSPPSPVFVPDANTNPTYYYLQFNSNGEVEAPATNVLLGVFEGYVNNGSEVATTKDGSGNPAAVEYISIAQYTGRAEPAEAVPTATPTPTP
jgi:type II secretory pathway pseudopilin PulG